MGLLFSVKMVRAAISFHCVITVASVRMPAKAGTGALNCTATQTVAATASCQGPGRIPRPSSPGRALTMRRSSDKPTG